MWGSVQRPECLQLDMQQHRLHRGCSATAWGSPRAGRQLGPLVQQRCTAPSPRRSSRRLSTRCQQAAHKEHTAGQTRYKDLSISERAEVLWDESLLRDSASAPGAESWPHPERQWWRHLLFLASPELVEVQTCCFTTCFLFL